MIEPFEEEKELLLKKSSTYFNSIIKKEFSDKLLDLRFYSTENQIILKDLDCYKKFKDYFYYIPHLVLALSLKTLDSDSIKNSKQIFFRKFEVQKSKKFDEKNNLKYIFIFELGAIIFWNFKVKEEKIIFSELNLKSSFTGKQNYLKKSVIEHNQNIFIKEIIKNDIIFLTSLQREEKLSISFVLALSIKLEEFEKSIDNIIENMEKESKFNLKSILLNYKKKKHSKRLAALFLLKAKLFLNINNIQDTFLMKISDNFLDNYKFLIRYFSIINRKKIIFKKYANIIEILSEVTLENKKKLDFNIYYLFIFWISIAIVLLLVQDIIEYIRFSRLSPSNKFRGGLVQKMVGNIYLLIRNTIGYIINI